MEIFFYKKDIIKISSRLKQSNVFFSKIMRNYPDILIYKTRKNEILDIKEK